MDRDPDFDDVYTLDPATQRYEIEVAVARHAAVFSAWDPAPFKRRALDPDLERYLEESAREIPAKQPIELCLLVADGQRDEALEEAVRDGIRTAFAFQARLERRALRRTTVGVALLAVAGLVALFAATAVWTGHPEQSIVALFGEALYIGGWVFVWEAITLVIFTRREQLERLRTFRRLHDAPVIFREEISSGAGSGAPGDGDRRA